MEEFKGQVDKWIILPIGIVEEHGRHLPLSTDSVQVEYIAERVAERIDGLIAPVLRYGICTSTRNFPGSISISFNTLRALVYDILSELIRHGAKNLLILSGHGGRAHLRALKLAAEKIVQNNKVNIILLSPYQLLYGKEGREFLNGLGIPEWDAHAGAIETSIMLALGKKFVKGTAKPSKPKLPMYRIVRHPEKYFSTGIIGDPTLASVDKGKRIMEWLVDRIVNLLSTHSSSNHTA